MVVSEPVDEDVEVDDVPEFELSSPGPLDELLVEGAEGLVVMLVPPPEDCPFGEFSQAASPKSTRAWVNGRRTVSCAESRCRSFPSI